jgi:hypothetical protein
MKSIARLLPFAALVSIAFGTACSGGGDAGDPLEPGETNVSGIYDLVAIAGLPLPYQGVETAEGCWVDGTFHPTGIVEWVIDAGSVTFLSATRAASVRRNG